MTSPIQIGKRISNHCLIFDLVVVEKLTLNSFGLETTDDNDPETLTNKNIPSAQLTKPLYKYIK